MAVQYIKYTIPFRDVNEQQYKVDIYGDVQNIEDIPATITLLAGNNPLTIDEDTSKDFFTPIRTQTGNLTICTKIPSGGILDISDIMPSNYTERPVVVNRWNESRSEYDIIWCGYLSCDSYNQAYTTIPENIQLALCSVLEVWKSMPYHHNASVISVGELMNQLIHDTYFFQFLQLYTPEDCSDIWDTKINTSIFVEKTEYQDEESTIYKVTGKSFYDILETICTFLGWTAREDGVSIYLQQAQGFGLLEDTETREMADLEWRGTNHQRSIVSGAKSVKVTANLEELDVNTELPELSFGALLESRDNLIDTNYVYTLPSVDVDAFSNITLGKCAADIFLGDDESTFQYKPVEVPELDIRDVIETSIPYAADQSQAVIAYNEYDTETRIYAGAFLTRMEIINYEEHDEHHEDTSDGVYLSLLPGTYQEGQELDPIFEMHSVQAFAAIEEGYLNLDAAFHTFWDMPAIDAVGDPCRFMLELQVGDRYLFWNDSLGKWGWSEQKMQFFPEVSTVVGEHKKFIGDWNDQLDIDEIGGLCIPTYYIEDGIAKNIMGEVVLRIYPQTKRYSVPPVWRNMVFGVFFEKLSITYIPKRSVERTDRSSNVFFDTIQNSFAEKKSIETTLASWLHNNPSPSLLYTADGKAPLQLLNYIKKDGSTEARRPESALLKRMKEYYAASRTILYLEVKHIETSPLPLLRFNGINDGKVYVPMAASRDYQTDTSTITFIECPEEGK